MTDSPPQPRLHPSAHCDQCGINCQDCLLDELRNDRDAWQKSCNHAKRQRDRAILKYQLHTKSHWHPDQDGEYAL